MSPLQYSYARPGNIPAPLVLWAFRDGQKVIQVLPASMGGTITFFGVGEVEITREELAGLSDQIRDFELALKAGG